MACLCSDLLYYRYGARLQQESAIDYYAMHLAAIGLFLCHWFHDVQVCMLVNAMVCFAEHVWHMVQIGYALASYGLDAV